MEENRVVVHRIFCKTLTNDGDKAKQYFSLVVGGKYEDTILIKKLILSKDEIDWLKLVKTYKDYYLYEQSFGIKFNTIAFVLNEFIQTLKTLK